MSNLCLIHHFKYNGNRCPICEKERIENMARRYKPKTEEKKEETPEKELEWTDLADKFNIKIDK